MSHCTLHLQFSTSNFFLLHSPSYASCCLLVLIASSLSGNLESQVRKAETERADTKIQLDHLMEVNCLHNEEAINSRKDRETYEACVTEEKKDLEVQLRNSQMENADIKVQLECALKTNEDDRLKIQYLTEQYLRKVGDTSQSRRYCSIRY